MFTSRSQKQQRFYNEKLFTNSVIFKFIVLRAQEELDDDSQHVIHTETSYKPIPHGFMDIGTGIPGDFFFRHVV